MGRFLVPIFTQFPRALRVPRGREVRGWTLEPEFTRRLAAIKNLTTSISSVIPRAPVVKKFADGPSNQNLQVRLAATKNLTASNSPVPSVSPLVEKFADGPSNQNLQVRLAATKNLTTSNSSVIPRVLRGKEVRG